MVDQREGRPRCGDGGIFCRPPGAGCDEARRPQCGRRCLYVADLYRRERRAGARRLRRSGHPLIAERAGHAALRRARRRAGARAERCAGGARFHQARLRAFRNFRHAGHRPRHDTTVAYPQPGRGRRSHRTAAARLPRTAVEERHDPGPRHGRATARCSSARRG